MMKNIVFSVLTSLLLICSIGQQAPTHELHAAMLYDFSQAVQWPEESAPGEFIVGVMGEDHVYNTMKERYNGKDKGPKRYVIKNLKSVDEAAHCHMVYIGKSRNEDFSYVKANTFGKSILTITDGIGLSHRGSCINFKVVDGKLRFELNRTSFNISNLKVPGELTNLAIVI